LIVGADVGGSTAKAILLERGRILGTAISRSAEDPVTSISGVLGKVLSDSGRSLTDIECLAASGGKSRTLPDTILGLNVKKVDEIQSTGIGGLELAGADEGLVVSVGTGTAVVWAKERGRKVTHVGGTGVGGGTIVGLGSKLLGISDPVMLNAMAQRGDSRAVDLTVGDIVGGAIGVLDASVTASNFGKMSEASSPDDIAAGILNMVAEVIGEVAYLSASSVGAERIILVGTLTKLSYISERALVTLKVFGRKAEIPKLAEFCVAVGAATKISWRT